MAQQTAKKIIKDITTPNTGVQAPSTLSSGVNYYAATDGFVAAWGGSGGKAIYSDATATPTTVVANSSAAAGGGGDFSNIMAPIKKGNYWRVSSASTTVWEAII